MPQSTAPCPMCVKAPKPRNPLVAPAMKRRAGRHQSATDAHARRLQSRLALRRLLRDRFPDDSP